MTKTSLESHAADRGDDLVDFPCQCERAPVFLPSLAEIAAACLEIQGTWSARERRRRQAGD